MMMDIILLLKILKIYKNCKTDVRVTSYMSKSDDDSESHTISLTTNDQSTLNDPIIQTMLKDRNVELEDHITMEDEIERQQRMYILLR